MAKYAPVSSVALGAIVCFTSSYGCEPDRVFDEPQLSADAGAAGMGPSSGGGGGGGGAGGQGSQTGEAGQTSCAEEQTLCGSACTDPTNDPQNCGNCGTKCSDTGACVDGHCWEWSEPASFGKAEQLAPAVGPDGDAAMGIVPKQAAGAEVWSSYYDATAMAWGTAASLMKNNQGLGPPRFAGTKDVAFAATDASSLGLQVLRRDAVSGAFTPMTLTPSYPAATFSLNTSYDGDLVVTYSALIDDGAKPYPLRVIRYDSDLASWGAEVELASDPTLYYLPVGTVLNASRDVHAFYAESALGQNNSWERKRLLWRRWSKKDAAWQPQLEVTGGRGYTLGAIATEQSGSVAAVWTDTLPGGKPDLRVSRYKADTATWTSEQLLETAEGAVTSCAAAFSGANLYVAWSQDGLDGAQVFLREYDAATSHWLDTEQLTLVPLDAVLLGLRSDAAGALFLHWQPPNSSHVVARFDPKRKVWTKPMTMQASDVASWGGGTLAVGPQGQAILAWSDKATSGGDLEGHARYFGPKAP